MINWWLFTNSLNYYFYNYSFLYLTGLVHVPISKRVNYPLRYLASSVIGQNFGTLVSGQSHNSQKSSHYDPHTSLFPARLQEERSGVLHGGSEQKVCTGQVISAPRLETVGSQHSKGFWRTGHPGPAKFLRQRLGNEHYANSQQAPTHSKKPRGTTSLTCLFLHPPQPPLGYQGKCDMKDIIFSK